jgi:photosystem II stability/assembly factor-like uncharacterized protein
MTTTSHRWMTLGRQVCGVRWPEARQLVSGVVVSLMLAFVAAVLPCGAEAADAESQRAWFWQFLGSPMGDAQLFEIEVDPVDDDIWYVTSEFNGVYITRDGGQSWEQHLSGSVLALTIHPTNPNVVYAGVGSTLYWTFDKGQTWMVRYVFPDEIPGDPTSSLTILITAADGTEFVGLGSSSHSARVYKSLLAGAWDIVFESTTGYRIWDMVEDPVSGAILFCTEDAGHTDNAVVMRSTNGGDTWNPVPELTGGPNSGHGLHLARHPVTGTMYFLEESSTLHVSHDGGATWPDDVYVDFGSVIAVDSQCPNRVFGGEFVRGVKVGGVYTSTTGGMSFAFRGPAHNSISGLGLTDGGSTLIAVAYGAGIWTQDLTGLMPCTNDVALFADGFEVIDLREWSDSVGWIP